MENNINKFSGKKQKELILEHVFSGHQFFLKSNYITFLQKILTFILTLMSIILYIHLGGARANYIIFFIVYLKLMFHPECDSPISCKGKKQ